MASREERQRAYSEKLKDPRWQKLRLQAFERDGWKCRCCGSSEKSLQVHHKEYERGKEPWEYGLASLSTLCCDCHEAEFHQRESAENLLLKLFRKYDWYSMDIGGLAVAICMSHGYVPTKDWEPIEAYRAAIKFRDFCNEFLSKNPEPEKE